MDVLPGNQTGLGETLWIDCCDEVVPVIFLQPSKPISPPFAGIALASVMQRTDSFRIAAVRSSFRA